MCTDDSPADLTAAIRHDVEPDIEIDLEPVDAVTVTTLMDNVTENMRRLDVDPSSIEAIGWAGAGSPTRSSSTIRPSSSVSAARGW